MKAETKRQRKMTIMKKVKEIKQIRKDKIIKAEKEYIKGKKKWITLNLMLPRQRNTSKQ